MPGRLARAAKKAGVKNFVHLSALAQDIDSPSRWAKTKVPLSCPLFFFFCFFFLFIFLFFLSLCIHLSVNNALFYVCYNFFMNANRWPFVPKISILLEEGPFLY